MIHSRRSRGGQQHLTKTFTAVRSGIIRYQVVTKFCTAVRLRSKNAPQFGQAERTDSSENKMQAKQNNAFFVFPVTFRVCKKFMKMKWNVLSVTVNLVIHHVASCEATLCFKQILLSIYFTCTQWASLRIILCVRSIFKLTQRTAKENACLVEFFVHVMTQCIRIHNWLILFTFYFLECYFWGSLAN